jgi:hypothetical protein
MFGVAHPTIKSETKTAAKILTFTSGLLSGCQPNGGPVDYPCGQGVISLTQLRKGWAIFRSKFKYVTHRLSAWIEILSKFQALLYKKVIRFKQFELIHYRIRWVSTDSLSRYSIFSSLQCRPMSSIDGSAINFSKIFDLYKIKEEL